MYLSHYNFNEKPFQITTDPKFIWLGEKYAEALAALEYGIQENKGLLLLTGDVGTGKTVMINTLLKKMDKKVITVNIPDPGLDPIDFYNILSNEFNMGRKFDNKGDFLIHLKIFLRETYLQNKKILLIIDEAQNISNSLLEEIRLLSNIELAEAKLINIFVVGQNELNTILGEDQNRALKQRIGIRHHLDPLNDVETHKYITHRLTVAGSNREIFSSEAIKDIHFYSSGIPRIINAICDCALLTGYSLGKDKIDDKVIKECARELKLQSSRKPDAKEKEKIVEGKGQALFEKKPGIPWRRLNPAASIIGLTIISAFIFYNLYLTHSQFSTMAEVASRDYKRYEEKIDLVKKEHSLAIEKPVSNLPIGKKIQKNIRVNAEKKYELPRSFIIFFKNNAENLSDNNLETLNKLAVSLKNYPNSEIMIEGYTDPHGNYWSNKKLSKVRANLVKSYFVKKGIIAYRMTTVGLGAENPIASNEIQSGRKMNHRVEIKIKSPDRDVILSKK